MLAGNDHHCVLALVHHTDDPFTATVTHTDTMSRTERKAAHKNLKVVQFVGSLPSPPLVVPIWINNPDIEGKRLTDLIISLGGYRGRARLVIPKLQLDGPLERLAEGLSASDDRADFSAWATKQVAAVRRNQRGTHPYDRRWADRQVRDISLGRRGTVLAARSREGVALRRIAVQPGSGHTVFLVLNRPARTRLGQAFELGVIQADSDRGDVIGGLDLRVELVPAPRR
jgi:hypothetical protein